MEAAHAVFSFLEEAAKSGILALTLTALALIWQTRKLIACEQRHDLLEEKHNEVVIGVARLYTELKALRGEKEPLPPLSDLLQDRRTR